MRKLWLAQAHRQPIVWLWVAAAAVLMTYLGLLLFVKPS
jgi:hypothetical protein